MADRKLVVHIIGDASKLDKSFKQAAVSVKGFDRAVGVSLKSVVKLGAAIGALSLASRAIGASVREFAEQAKAAAQTEAVIKSTGGVAGVTAKHVDELAESISRLSGIDDEAARAGENMLLTFTQIRNVVGKNNDVFDQATRLTADLSVAMGIDMKRAALQVGKALNDPARGYARLQRIGVAFSAEQVKQIKSFVATGDVMSAQRVILAELAKEFGGSAKALGETVPGQINRIRETLLNIGGDIVGKVAPAFLSGLTAVSDFVTKLGEARTVRAKFEFIVDGIAGLGKQLFDGVRGSLEKVDFGEAVTVVQDELVRGLRNLGAFLEKVDYSRIGKAIGTGLLNGVRGTAAFLESVDWGIVGRKIVNGIADFLKAVDWVAVIKATIRLIIAAIRGLGSLIYGAGKEIGKGLLAGAKAGLIELGNTLHALSLKIVLKVIEPFTHVPRAGGEWARDLKENLKVELESLADTAEKTAVRVERVMGIIAQEGHKPRAKPKPPKAPEKKPDPELITSAVVPTDTAAIKDAEDKAAKAAEKAAAAAAKAAQDAAAKAARIAAAKAARRNANQFLALGLTASGEQRAPGVEALRKMLGSLDKAIEGTPLDSKKTGVLLDGVRKVLSGKLGVVGREVRLQIDTLFNDLRDRLKGFDKDLATTKFRKVNLSQSLLNFGLSPEQVRKIRQQVTQVSFNGNIPNRQPAFAGAGAFGTHTETINLIVDGEKLATVNRRHERKAATRRVSSRRGPFAGRG